MALIFTVFRWNRSWDPIEPGDPFVPFGETLYYGTDKTATLPQIYEHVVAIASWSSKACRRRGTTTI